MNPKHANKASAGDIEEHLSPPDTLVTQALQNVVVTRCKELWDEYPHYADIWSELMLVCAKVEPTVEQEDLFEACFSALADHDDQHEITRRLGDSLQTHLQPEVVDNTIEQYADHKTIVRYADHEWIRLYGALARHEVASMQLRYATCLLLGRGIEQDRKAAGQWMDRILGGHYPRPLKQESGMPKIWINWRSISFSRLRQAYSRRWARRKFLRGVRYRDGTDVKQDDKKAFDCFLQAAKQGHLQAMAAVAEAYLYAKGVKHNYREALQWATSGAEKHNPEAECCLGQLYAMGLSGVYQNHALAIFWFCKAAEQGNAEAIRQMQLLYTDNTKIYPNIE